MEFPCVLCQKLTKDSGDTNGNLSATTLEITHTLSPTLTHTHTHTQVSAWAGHGADPFRPRQAAQRELEEHKVKADSLQDL